MSERRVFTKSQRTRLYIEANGRCEKCGQPLGTGWQADHITPFSKGGSTTLENGQALCLRCNQSKADSMPGSIEPRPFQRDALKTARSKVERGEDTLVAVAAPGSGKTLMSQMVMNELWRRGIINSLLTLTPRVNLCGQYETDWKKDRQKLTGETMGQIFHVQNDPPILGREAQQFGASATYDSLNSNPRLYKRLFERNRMGLILDEAQILGTSPYGGSTESHDEAEELAEMAAFTIIMTGTARRSDDRLILPKHVDYSEPDKTDTVYMQPDVKSGYIDGVKQGFLRRFEYELHDGGAERKYMDRTEELTLEELESGIGDVVSEPGFWKPMCDKTAKRIREMQEVHPEFCGLVGAYRQWHARDIREYLEREHNLDVKLAVSDSYGAQSNLKQFRNGEGDVIVTVGMCHVGFDHKPVTVVCALNHIRSYPWMFQFFARGLRMWDKVEEERQYLRAIVPNDPQMEDFVEQMRTESKKGIQLREPGGDGPPPSPEPEPYKTQNGRVGDVHAKNFNPERDVDPDFYDKAEQHATELCPGVTIGNLQEFYERVSGSSSPDEELVEQGGDELTLTHKQKIEGYRKALTKKLGRKMVAHRRQNGDDIAWKHYNSEAFGLIDGGFNGAKSIDALKKLERWLRGEADRIGFIITDDIEDELNKYRDSYERS